MEILKNFFNAFRPDGEKCPKPHPVDNDGMVTNKKLYEELIDHFKADMEELSVGKRILYPMSFNILLHPSDYNRLVESFPYVLPVVIAGFYAAIKTKKDSIHNSVYTPPATYWFFQFASSSVKTENHQEAFMVPGEIVTVGNLTTFDIKKAKQGSIVENTRLSIKCVNSNVNQNNINQEALLGMEILSNNAFAFNFDKNMSEELIDIQSSQRGAQNALATLIYPDGQNYRQYDMMDDLVTISGPKETRNMENILVINNDAVEVGHVQIRYVKETNKFQLCAFSETRLNTSNVPISVGGAPDWRDMSYKSDIFLNGEVNIKFKAADRIISRV